MWIIDAAHAAGTLQCGTDGRGVDAILGPEMRSTGEVMGIDKDFATAFAKAQIGAGTVLPTSGTVFISLKDTDKPVILLDYYRVATFGATQVAPMLAYPADLGGLSPRQLRVLERRLR